MSINNLPKIHEQLESFFNCLTALKTTSLLSIWHITVLYSLLIKHKTRETEYPVFKKDKDKIAALEGWVPGIRVEESKRKTKLDFCKKHLTQTNN